MNVTGEGLFLAILFIVPGLLFWHTSNYRQDLGDLTLTLLSAAATGFLLTVEGLFIVGVIAPLFSAVDEALARVLEVGLLDYARERPKMVSAFVLGIPLLNSVILGLIGWKFRKIPTQPPLSLWTWLMKQGPVLGLPASGYRKFATVRLKTGESYRGLVAELAPTPTGEDSAELVLLHVEFQQAAGKDWTTITEGELGSLVVLQKQNWDTIEFLYTH